MESKKTRKKRRGGGGTMGGEHNRHQMDKRKLVCTVKKCNLLLWR